MPDLRQLRAFVAVAEELNFTRAAARLFVAQQAVSRAVAQLEQELGVTLLERTTHAVALTPAGAALLASGRAVLVAADDAFAEARTIGRGLAGTVRVGLSPAVGPQVRTEALRALRADAPELAVAFHEVRPGDVARLLRERAVDLVLARTAPADPAVESAALRPTPAVLLVPAGHPAAGTAEARLADLDGERLLVWNPPGTPYTDLLLARLAAAGARVEAVTASVTGTGDLPDVAAGDAVAVVPEGWPAADGVVPVPLADAVDLPLLVLWAAGAVPEPVRRLRAGMASG